MANDDRLSLADTPPASLEDLDICRSLGDQLGFRADAPAGDAEGSDSGDDGSPGTMFGHFSTFGDWYRVRSFWEGDFIERMAKGSFKRTINNRSDQSPVRVLLDHGFDPELGDRPLGVPEVLKEDDVGPYAETPLFEGVPRMIVAGLRAGAYGQSFRFQVMHDEWVDDPEAKGYEDSGNDDWKGLPQRTIKEVRLIEFGPTPFPANPNVDTGLRSSTDQFYERLRRRDPGAYDAMLARAAIIRAGITPEQARRIVIDLGNNPRTPAPAGPAAVAPSNNGKTSKTEDPPTGRHSDDPPAGHSTDSPAAKHSSASRPAIPARAATPSTEGSTTMTDAAVEPMTAEEREARQSEIRARLAEIDTEHNGAELSPEVQTEWDSLNSEFDTNERAIAADVKRKERIRELAARQAGETAAPTHSPALHRRPDNPFDLTAIRQQARSIDEVPALYREAALRVIDDMRIPLSRDRRSGGPGGRKAVTAEDSKENLRHILDYVDDEKGTLARRILVTGSPLYQRAFGKFCLSRSTMGLTTEEQRALAIGAGGTGGFAVPVMLDPTLILVSAGSKNPLRRISRVEQIVGKEWDGVTTTGITVSRAAEAAQSSDNAPALLQPTVKAERVQGFVPFSFEVDQDWSSLQSEMFRLLADAKDQEEVSSFTTGNGTSPNPGGFLDATNGILAASNVNFVTVTAAAVYGLENAMNIRFRDNATFVGSKPIYNAIRQIDTAGGAQLWARIGEGQPARLLDYPAEEDSAMPSNPTPALNDRWLVLGDFEQFLIVDRIGMTVDLIPHLFGANQRPTGQRGLYAFWRNNCKVLVSDAFRVAFRNV